MPSFPLDEDDYEDDEEEDKKGIRFDIHHHIHRSEEKKIYRRTCAWCKGKGKVRNEITGSPFGAPDCDVCGGDGKNIFYSRPEECPICGRSGEERAFLSNRRKKCHHCGGKGYIEIV